MTLIRKARIDDCDALGLITVTASHSAFIGAVAEELLDFSWTPAVSAAGWRNGFAGNTDRGQSFHVAEQGSRVVGFVWTKPWADTAGYDASVKGLYVLPTCQRRGLGRSLLSFAASDLHANGARSLEIGCVVENPSCGFYRRLGGVEIGRRSARVDQLDTEEILFGWPDLSQLL